MDYLDKHMQKLIENRNRYHETIKKRKTGSIEQELSAWWKNLLDAERQPYYTMAFFIHLTHGFYGRRRSAGDTGVALYAAGFRRQRLWSDGPAIRIWVPPKLPKLPLNEQSF